MALDQTKMNCSNVGHIARYVYTKGADTITATGYFNDMAKKLKVGDIIEHIPTAGGVVAYTVTVNNGSAVTIAAAA